MKKITEELQLKIAEKLDEIVMEGELETFIVLLQGEDDTAIISGTKKDVGNVTETIQEDFVRILRDTAGEIATGLRIAVLVLSEEILEGFGTVPFDLVFDPDDNK